MDVWPAALEANRALIIAFGYYVIGAKFAESPPIMGKIGSF